MVAFCSTYRYRCADEFGGGSQGLRKKGVASVGSLAARGAAVRSVVVERGCICAFHCITHAAAFGGDAAMRLVGLLWPPIPAFGHTAHSQAARAPSGGLLVVWRGAGWGWGGSTGQDAWRGSACRLCWALPSGIQEGREGGNWFPGGPGVGPNNWVGFHTVV